MRFSALRSLLINAFGDIRLPVKLMLMLTLLFAGTVMSPTDLRTYPMGSPARPDIDAVTFTENYLRFVPTVVQIALPLVLMDRIGMAQLVLVGVSTTLVTHGAKRLFNDWWIGGTRLGERPNRMGGRHNMPSGHSSMASCAVYFIGRRYSFKLALLMVPILLLTMYARVALNDHTISAVIAGALVGFLTAACCTSGFIATARRLRTT